MPAHQPTDSDSPDPTTEDPAADALPWQSDGGDTPPFQTPTPGAHLTKDELEADLDEESAD